MKMQRKASITELPKGPFFRRFAVEAARDKKAFVEIEANADECRDVAEFLAIPGVVALTARFEITLLNRGRFNVTGWVSARIVQTCVVTLEDFEAEVREPVEAIFAEPQEVETVKIKGREVAILSIDSPDEPPEPVVDGGFDLGALATEFLALGLDPWPRKPEAAFSSDAIGEAPPEKTSAFAALAQLRKDRDGGTR